MRIVVFGGLARSLLNFRGPLIKAMVARGHEVTACAPDASEAVREDLAALGVRYEHVPVARAGLNPFSDLRTLCAAYRLFRRLRPDHVLAYTIKPVIWGCLAARLARVPSTHSMITGLRYAFSDDGGRKQVMIRRLVQSLYRLGLARCRTVFFQNPDDLATFTTHNLVPDTAQTVLINGSGVDLDWYTPCPLPDQPVYLLVARLLIDKGVREYVEAARKLRQKYPQAVFQIAGYCDANPASVQPEEVQAWVHEGVIQYLGQLEDVRPAFAGARVYVLPSYYEGTPRTVLEAMAMGRPVITTDAPGCRETVVRHDAGMLECWDAGIKDDAGMLECWDAGIKDDAGMLECGDAGIKDDAGMLECGDAGMRSRQNGDEAGGIVQGRNGFLVPVRVVEALAGAMERFIVEPGLAERMGAESLRIAREKYDVHKVNEVILGAMGV